jgi:hypothetical protein
LPSAALARSYNRFALLKLAKLHRAAAQPIVTFRKYVSRRRPKAGGGNNQSTKAAAPASAAS